MNIKLKTMGLIGATMIICISLVFLFVRPVLLENANEMDQESLEKDRVRAVNHLDSTASDLQSLNRDWAIWDDTYNFADTLDPVYIQSNIFFETFENNDINLMVFLNEETEIYFSAGYDLQTSEEWEDNSFAFMNSMLLEELEHSEAGTIIYDTRLGLLLLTSEKILPSNEEGPFKGYLVMGKILDYQFFKKMNNQLVINTEVLANPWEIREAVTNAEQKNRELVSKVVYLGDDIAIGVEKDRKYYNEKLRSINDLFIYMTLAMLIITFITYSLMNSLVLSRISFLANQLKGINVSNPETFQVKKLKNADDEITALEDAFQEMVESLGGAHREISQMAYFDYLTDLPNRLNLSKYFKDEIEDGTSVYAILFFDLDGFKRINDLFGHNIGDEVLKQVGRRLKNWTSDDKAVLFRIGGDEFIMITPFDDKNRLTQMIEQLLCEIRKEISIKNIRTSLSTSIGISVYPSDGNRLSDLLQYADTAMYEAKKTGKNGFCFYEELQNKELHNYYLNLKEDLLHALNREEFFLEYQPVMNPEAEKISGVEALIRWRHPEFGIIPPLHFIPLAEESGLIRNIGAWVIRQAVKDISSWNDKFTESISVAVNVSNYQLNFKEELISTIDSVLGEYDFKANLLHVEITESDMVVQEEEMINFIQELKAKNIVVSLDDFGVGASSLFKLIQLDVDRVKIDRSFLQKVPAGANDTILLKRIYQTLGDLGIEVVTEGIETEEQLRFVQRESHSYLQGYYFSKPLTLGKLKDWKNSQLKETHN
ncbi:bifunctional diguanylate cyclase/phosphodiesterase [Planomicrobium okeanokoites]|uniref:EAL domain-containing protein n=1 Tax=Planomicrobium okeanokoites TaxID=244 RepID=A0ABV7KRV7_PLAOK|nr:EAL domain-containing protein [Planomicrobium okeanokoites]